jgi:hypothetical protein
MERTKGCLTVVVGLLALGIVINILRLTWPVGLPAGLAGVGWFFTVGSKQPIKSAVHAVLGPVTIGLLLVAVLLLFFNSTSPPADVIGNAERALVYLDNEVPSWSKLSPGAFVVAIAGLIVLTYWMPGLKLITHFLAVNKFSSKATAALGAATSFTFFTNVAVVQPKVPSIYLKIEAAYRNSTERKHKAVDRFLAAKVVQRALITQEPSGSDYCRFLLDGIAAIPAMDMVSKQSLAGYVAQQLYHDIKPVKIGSPEIDTTLLPHRSALTMLDSQLSTERAASTFADEAAKATKELFSKILGLGNDKLESIAWSFADKLIAEQADSVDQLARPFIDKIVDKYFEKYTDPIVEKQAEAVRRLFEHPGSTSEAKVVANSQTRSAMALMNTKEAELARDAAQQALDAAQTAKKAASAGDTVAVNVELAKAERASAQALKAADLAKAASESITKVPGALRAAQNQTLTATIATGAVESAQGVLIATETAEAAEVARSVAQAVEAAKAAKSAAQAVEAARSARGAAEAAEAAKLLLKVIPK